MQPNKVIILLFLKNRINHCDKVRVLRPSGYYASPHAALREIRVWDLWSRPFLLIWILSSSTWCDPSFECGISCVCNRAVRSRLVCLLKSFLKRSLFLRKFSRLLFFLRIDPSLNSFDVWNSPLPSGDSLLTDRSDGNIILISRMKENIYPNIRREYFVRHPNASVRYTVYGRRHLVC